MVDMLRSTEHRTVRVIVREFIEHYIEGEDEITLGDLQDAARTAFWDDAEMHAALLTDALDSFVGDILHDVMIRRRSGEKFYRTESGYVSDTKVEIGAREIFARIFESVGDGRRKSLLACTKADIAMAIRGREKMIAGLSRYNDFLREIMKPLRGNETIGDHYREAQLQAFWSQFKLSATTIPQED